MAIANRDYLRGFYGVIKGSARHIRFTFVTGISQFARVSFFSGMNHLKDISLTPHYATICGYTDADIDTVFMPELTGLDRDRIRQWYDGYNWCGTESLYNPFDVLLLFDEREFAAYWFETASPSHLFKILKEKSISPVELEGCTVERSELYRFEIEEIRPEAFLFQSGYLTIARETRKGHKTFYELDYPNQEVKLSLNDKLLTHLDRGNVGSEEDEGESLKTLLEAHDFSSFADRIRIWFSSIPYQWHKNDPAHFEAWYAGLLHMCFCSIGIRTRPEESSSHGRADLVIELGEEVFIMEFKAAEREDQVEAMLEAAFTRMRAGLCQQIRESASASDCCGLWPRCAQPA